MSETNLIIQDQVNVRFTDLDPKVRRQIRKKLGFFRPYARHTPTYKMGRWDGYEYLFDMGGRTFLNVSDTVIETLMEKGYEINVDDRRPDHDISFPIIDENVLSHKTWPKGHKHEDEPIKLKPHQVEALNNFFDDLSCVQELPTSSGKTILTAAMCYHAEQYGRTLTIVPNKQLVNQTEEDFQNIGLDVGVYFGDRKEPDHQHIICTWQILNLLDKKSKADDEEKKKIKELLNDVNCVIVDEVHQAKAKAIKNLLTGRLSHVPIRWGLTGTIPKDDYEYSVIISALGPVIARIEPKELQEQGVLANCNIDILQLQDGKEFSSLSDEREFLYTDETRLRWLAEYVEELVKTSGNALILVDRIKTGEKLEQMIEGSVFISGSTKIDERKEHYMEVAKADDKPIIATFGVAAVGINVPRIFNLILLEPGKSFVRTIQSIGRGLRLAKDKSSVNIVDVCSDCKYSKRHLTERKKYYKEKQFEHNVKKIDYK